MTLSLLPNLINYFGWNIVLNDNIHGLTLLDGGGGFFFLIWNLQYLIKLEVVAQDDKQWTSDSEADSTPSQSENDFTSDSE